MLAAACLALACGGGGGDGPCLPSEGCVPPIANDVQVGDLDGKWEGVLEDVGLDVLPIAFTIESGAFTAFAIDGRAVPEAVGVSLLVAGPRLFRFTFAEPDFRRGVLLTDGSGEYASYADSDFGFGVVEKSFGMSDPQASDLVGTWVGASALIDQNFTQFASAGGIAACDDLLDCSFRGVATNVDSGLKFFDDGGLWFEIEGLVPITVFVSSDGLFAGALLDQVDPGPPARSGFGAWRLQAPAP